MKQAFKKQIIDLLDQHRILTIATNREDGWPQATVSALARAVSPFNWTVIVENHGDYRYAHVNLRATEIPPDPGRDAFFITRMAASFRPVRDALWQQTSRFGRAPDDLKIMPGLFPVVGRTEAEARAKFEELQALIDPVVGLALLSRMIGGHDLSGYDPDGPVPELPETEGGKSRQQLMFDLARREGLTLRQLYLRIAGARGHSQIVGTPAQIVDEMEARFRAGGADGFNIMPPTLPGGLDDFIALVLPELRRRGLVRTEYEGRTLREHLGSRPPAGYGPGKASASRG